MGFIAACSYSMGDLGMGIPNDGTATSETITLPDDQSYSLLFFVMPDISPAANADALSLEVVEGGAAATIWEKEDLGAQNFGPNWVGVTLNLSEYAGKTIQLRFVFDSLGGTGSGGKGVFIDDLALTADCNPE